MVSAQCSLCWRVSRCTNHFFGTQEICTSLGSGCVACYDLGFPFLQETCVEAAVIQNYRKLSDLQVTNVLFFNSCPFFRSGPWLLPPSYLCVFLRARWGMSSPHPPSDPGPKAGPSDPEQAVPSRSCPSGARTTASPAPWMPSAVVFSVFSETTGSGDR